MSCLHAKKKRWCMLAQFDTKHALITLCIDKFTIFCNRMLVLIYLKDLEALHCEIKARLPLSTTTEVSYWEKDDDFVRQLIAIVVTSSSHYMAIDTSYLLFIEFRIVWASCVVRKSNLVAPNGDEGKEPKKMRVITTGVKKMLSSFRKAKSSKCFNADS